MIKFKSENTSINNGHSRSSEIVVNIANSGDYKEFENEIENLRILDYGCGSGRNIKYILDNSRIEIIDGIETTEQLEKEEEKHLKLMEQNKNVIIDLSEKLPSDYYEIAICSHVLNVVESDEIKLNILRDIKDKLIEGGIAIIEVRTKKDVESAKTKEKYGNGWKIKKGNSFTYQEAITKEKMEELVNQVGFNTLKHICNSSKHIIVLEK